MADFGTVESLARLQLAARRCGGELRLCRVPKELEELITFVRLERGDVAGEKLLVDLARVGRVEIRGGEGRPRPLEGAVHRGDARLEELRDFGGLPAQHLAEDQHRALAGREVLERGDEGEPD